MALDASVAGRKEALIPASNFLDCLEQMHTTSQRSQQQLQADSQGFVPLYQASLCLMGQVWNYLISLCISNLIN